LAVDYGKLTENLGRFYDFTGKVVLFVGAGGRQLFDASIRVKKLVAIDQDVESLKELKTNIAAKGMQNSVDVIGSSFEDVTLSGDVVYFEFCLHEMVEPLKALTHARTLAPDIVVFDHSPGSDWAFHAAEEDKVRRSAEAMKRFGLRRRLTFRTEQRFQDHAELLAKVAGQGAIAIERAQRFAGVRNIVIPMSYELALL
jgi:ubiquinone/menaquinone biosynthesis C-methylase UbiE